MEFSKLKQIAIATNFKPPQDLKNIHWTELENEPIFKFIIKKVLGDEIKVPNPIVVERFKNRLKEVQKESIKMRELIENEFKRITNENLKNEHKPKSIDLTNKLNSEEPSRLELCYLIDEALSIMERMKEEINVQYGTSHDIANGLDQMNKIKSKMDEQLNKFEKFSK